MVDTVAELIAAIKNGYRTKSVFHFTDAQNLRSIKRHGLLSKQQLAEKGIVPVNPGGDSVSQRSDRSEGIYDDVSLSLARKHSMAHVCKREERQEEQIVFAIDPTILSLPNVRIAHGMANSPRYPKMELQDGMREIDVEVMYTNHGRPWDDVRDIVTRMQKFELLVPQIVEPRFLLGYWSI